MSNYVIREVKRGDAAGMLAFITALSEEPDIYISLGPGEFTFTVEQQEEYFQNIFKQENSVIFVAEAKGEIIGNVRCQGGQRKSNAHLAVIGISVAKAWRGQGIGAALMEKVVEWGRENPILKRLELYVFTVNEPAVHIYKKLGFEIEGQRKKAYFRQGRYYDDYVMALMV